MAPSIVHRLRWRIFLLSLIVLVPMAIGAARIALLDIDAFCDARLAQAALTMEHVVSQMGVDSLAVAEPGDALPVIPVLPPTGKVPTHEVEVGYQVADRNGRVVLATENLRRLTLPGSGAGFHDARVDGKLWRLYSHQDADDGFYVTAGERHDSRRDILRALWMEHLLPLVLGLPLLAWAVAWSVHRALAPLARLAETLRTRPAGSRQVIEIGVPSRELAPLVDALNLHIRTLEHAWERETRLTVDVAHELRTPIASVMINIEGSLAGDVGLDRADVLRDAHDGLEALHRRTGQLMTLARLDDSSFVASTPVDLCGLVECVVEEMAHATRAGTATVVHRLPVRPVWVPGDRSALAALLRNLIENALRHTPTTGEIFVDVIDAGVACVLEVTDNGPGIPRERHEAVFERFRRDSTLGDGFGVGLSIVQRVARLHAASVEFLDAPQGHGLVVRVSIPRWPSTTRQVIKA
ncbi:MAG TPA: ATP-binding protein [Luteibacter sp.]|nr:ATP-binding protein [Luteibacter sp.]